MIRRTQVTLTTASDGTAGKQLSFGRPGVVRFLKVDYASDFDSGGDIVIKADSSSGATLFSKSDNATDLATAAGAPKAVGTAGMDEGNSASAATDGLAGGLPFTSGLYISVAQGGDTKSVTVDIIWETVKHKRLTMTSDSAGAGSAAASLQWTYGRPGVLRFLQVDYGASEAATADLAVKQDNSSGGTVFTNANSGTDFGPKAVGTVAMDEGAAATAATDAVDGGIPFYSGLYFALAQGNNAKVTAIDIWFD
jgi:hypothetical protein